MRVPHFILWLGLLATVSVLLSACGGYSRGDTSGAAVVIDETGAISAGSACMTEDDCDGDGVFAECDPDDGDAEQFSLADDCDVDGDGYADTSCSDFDDGDGFLSDEERAAIGVNCDVCPDMNDPTQDDSDQDGRGDLCTLSANVNISAFPTETDAGTDDSVAATAGTADTATNTADDSAADISDDPADDTDATEPATDPDDPDGDGLSDAIDPDPDTANAWGYINATTAETDHGALTPITI